jgi:maleate isomerase
MDRSGLDGDGGRQALPVIGVVLLATDLTTERDIRRLVPPEVAACATRIAYRNPTTAANLAATLPRLGAAARLIVPGTPLAALYYACTSASIVLGHDAVAAAVAEARPGVPVVTPAEAAVSALAALGARRIAVLSPYLPETAALVERHFAARGFDVAAAEALGMADDRDMARLEPAAIRAAARRAAVPGADALFISCTALPATALVPAIEAEIGRPVVTSNLAGLWQCLRLAGATAPRAGLGRLMGLVPEAVA